MQEEEEEVQAKAAPGHGPASAGHTLSNKIKESSGRGRALPDQTRSEMEHSFGVNFSGVNIHTDTDAQQLNRKLGAQAFTHGKDIYFNSGKFNPSNASGKHLLAHELTHVVQQNPTDEKIQRKPGDGHDLTSNRFSGNARLEATYDNEAVVKKYTEGDYVTLIQQALLDLGYELPEFGADGKFGSETRNAVIAFQKDNGLNDDGILGFATMEALDKKFPDTPKPIPPSPEPVPPKPTPPVDPDPKMATLKIHADTETKNRSKLTFKELRNALVGHSWVSLEFKNKTDIPDKATAPTTSLIKDKGTTAFGFWPLINRASAFTDEQQARIDSGYTPGSGTSINAAHTGFSMNPFKWVPGRVEEPDTAHKPKGSKSYDLKKSEVNNMLKYVNSKRNAQYNLYRFNCTTFAIECVNAAGKTSPGGKWAFGIALPNALYKDIYQMHKKGDSSTWVAPLKPGEIHENPPKKK